MQHGKKEPHLFCRNKKFGPQYVLIYYIMFTKYMTTETSFTTTAVVDNVVLEKFYSKQTNRVIKRTHVRVFANMIIYVFAAAFRLKIVSQYSQQ